MGVSDAIRDWLLQPILTKLDEIEQEVQNMATSQAQFDTLLTQLGTVVTNEDSAIATGLTAINAALVKLAAGVAGNADLTSEATAAQAMIADIQTQTTNLSAAVAKLQAAS